jgi:hypothetical protein
MNNTNPPTHIVYNTGDEIWVTYEGSMPTVIKVKTHDGIVWEVGQSWPWDVSPVAGGGCQGSSA